MLSNLRVFLLASRIGNTLCGRQLSSQRVEFFRQEEQRLSETCLVAGKYNPALTNSLHGNVLPMFDANRSHALSNTPKNVDAHTLPDVILFMQRAFPVIVLGVGRRWADFISPQNSMKAHKARTIRRFGNPPNYINSHISMQFNAKIVYGLCRS